ncbi:MAG: class I SAM-dependent methyltransferase [Myxococcota bacterium]
MTNEARRWNLSPECLYVECWTRVFLREHLEPQSCPTVCNVGVGAGDWDDWLGYWLEGHGSLVSVDIDGALVHEFRERQARDRHPNPARAIHGDLLKAELGRFSLVTLVGSTLHETHAPALALQTAQRWVEPGGWLLATVLHGMGDPARLTAELVGVTHRRAFVDLPEAAFTAVLARCP